MIWTLQAAMDFALLSSWEALQQRVTRSTATRVCMPGLATRPVTSGSALQVQRQRHTHLPCPYQRRVVFRVWCRRHSHLPCPYQRQVVFRVRRRRHPHLSDPHQRRAMFRVRRRRRCPLRFRHPSRRIHHLKHQRNRLRCFPFRRQQSHPFPHRCLPHCRRLRSRVQARLSYRQ